MARTLISTELDEIAGGIQGLGKKHPRHAKRLKALAAELDIVSNQVDKEAEEETDSEKSGRSSSRRKQAGIGNPEQFAHANVGKMVTFQDEHGQKQQGKLIDWLEEGVFVVRTPDKLDHDVYPEDMLGGASGGLHASRRKQAAAPPIEDGIWPHESDLQDSYEAKDYHKVPVGNDSLSKAIDSNLPDKMSDLQFAQNTSGKDKHRILIQAGKGGRRASWPFGDLDPKQFDKWVRNGQWSQVRKAASMALSQTNVHGSRTAAEKAEMEVDTGRFGAEDNLSTADLGESGNEDITKPVDYDDEGGVLQFFGTYPQKSNDDGPDSGHHRRDVAAPNRERSSSKSARTLLERIADRPVKPEVKQPDQLLNDEDGNNVERDQPLGGLSGQYKGRKSGRAAGTGEVEVNVHRPEHVPAELHAVWHRAAQRLAGQGRLLLSTGDVDYYAIDDVYREGLAHCRKKAAAQCNGRQASRLRYAATPTSVEIVRPAFVPRELTSYWTGAAEYLGGKDRLVTASGKVDYDGVNRHYIKLLDHVSKIEAD